MNHIYMGDVWGTRRPDSFILKKKIDKMDSKFCFEMILFVVEAIRGRCASFMILTATVWEMFGGQTNSSILVLYRCANGSGCCGARVCRACAWVCIRA